MRKLVVSGLIAAATLWTSCSTDKEEPSNPSVSAPITSTPSDEPASASTELTQNLYEWRGELLAAGLVRVCNDLKSGQLPADVLKQLTADTANSPPGLSELFWVNAYMICPEYNDALTSLTALAAPTPTPQGINHSNINSKQINMTYQVTNTPSTEGERGAYTWRADILTSGFARVCNALQAGQQPQDIQKQLAEGTASSGSPAGLAVLIWQQAYLLCPEFQEVTIIDSSY